jgi:hypothetical protein
VIAQPEKLHALITALVKAARDQGYNEGVGDPTMHRGAKGQYSKAKKRLNAFIHARIDKPTEDTRMNFEIAAAGYDGSTDATDDRVIWVSAPTRLHLDSVLEGVKTQSVSDLPREVDPQDLDYLLPEQDQQLREQLKLWEAKS